MFIENGNWKTAVPTRKPERVHTIIQSELHSNDKQPNKQQSNRTAAVT